MALQLGALRDALLNAGTSPEKADKAAEEVAGYETRLSSIEAKLAIVTWMVGFSITLTIALGLGNLWLAFQILSRVAK